MLKLFSLMKYAFVRIIKLGVKAYKARERLIKFGKRVVFSFVNVFIVAVHLFFNVARRGLVLIAQPLPQIIRLLLYYLSCPIFRNVIRTRLFLQPHLDLETLFAVLKERDIRYVILRWFDKLPFVEKGEDIDILIDDTHLSQISDLFTWFPIGQPFDVYSVSGVENTSYRGLPYYPPNIAEKILDSRILFKNLYFVPDTLHYFLSLAYHVVYHKGKLSGLPNGNNESYSNPDHDYEAILRRLSEQLKMQVDLTFHGTHNYLLQNSWSPNIDTLRKLSANDSWISELLPDEFTLANNELGEFMVFILRDWVLLHNKLDTIVEKLMEKDLDIILVKMLNDQEREVATASLRGGNWDRGPYPVDGGEPRYIIACFDYHPVPTLKRYQKSHPFIKNKHILIKNDIRDEFNGDTLWFYWTNCIHSADDEIEAWDYIQQVLPNEKSMLMKQVQIRRNLYGTIFSVQKQFHSCNTRAKLEIIDYHGKKAVKKTFKLGCERFCEREVFAYRYFGNLTNMLPELLETGENYLVTRWYENSLEDCSNIKRNVMLEPYGSEIIKIMRLFFDEGYALVDFYPGNVILTPGGEIRIIDIEFLYKYKTKPNSFLDSYDIKGIPTDFDGDLPLGIERGSRGRTYNNTWRFIFGPLEKYVSDI